VRRVAQVLAAVTLLALASPKEVAARRFVLLDGGSCKATCNCYWSSDCGSNQSCGGYFSCEQSGKLDGTCRSSGGLSPGDFPILHGAVDDYYQAFLAAAMGGGGLPDAEISARAQGKSLSLEGHFAAQQIVNDSLDVVLGFDFLRPQIMFCHGFGQIFSFRSFYPREAEELVDATRRGVVDAIRAKEPARVGGPIRGFWAKHPNYRPLHTGRCFPHGHPDFPYKAPADCQIRELEGMLKMFMETTTPKAGK
jgi:hypothetical protein